MNLKRYFIVLLSIVFSIALLCACASGGNQESNNNSQEDSQPTQQTQQEKPLVYFSFDEVDQNGNFYDCISGDASKSFGQPLRVSGKNGNALKIRDAQTYLSFVTDLPNKNQAHTIMAWIKLDLSRINASSENVIAGWGNYTQFQDTRLMLYHNEICVTSFGVFTTYPIPHDANEKWYHVALTYDESDYCMYVNGIKVKTVSAPNALNIQQTPLYIGGFGENFLNFSGDIDDLYVLDKVLDRSEIVKYKNSEVKFEMAKPNNKQPKDSTVESFDSKNSKLSGGWNEFIYSDGVDSVPFKIFMPDNYDKNKKYPVILFLHGDGSNGATVDTVIQGTESTVVKRALIEGEDCIAIVPVARSPWLVVPNDKNVVYPYKKYSMQDAAPSNQLLAVEKLLVDCIENLAIDASRVYLAGYSRGTMAIWYLLQKTPERYAAATVCCGAGDPDVAYKFKDVPIWVFMGNADPLVSFNDIQAIFDAYEQEGGNGEFTVCQGGNHDVSRWLFAEKNLINWLFSCSK